MKVKEDMVKKTKMKMKIKSDEGETRTDTGFRSLWDSQLRIGP